MKPNFKKLIVHKQINRNVTLLKLFPGITDHAVQAVLNTYKLKALVLETFGSGNAPTDIWFIRAIETAIRNGVIVLVVTQCKGGSVEIGKYETSRYLGETGVLSGFDITSEAAVTKMMFLLGNCEDKTEMRRLLQTSMRGEMTV